VEFGQVEVGLRIFRLEPERFLETIAGFIITPGG